MFKNLVIAFSLLYVVNGMAQPYPYTIEEAARFNVIEALTSNTGTDGLYLKKVARATYSVTADGGSTGTYALGVTLPASAILTQSYLKFNEVPVDPSTSTIAFSCASADDILSAADLTGQATGTLLAGIQDGTAANMLSLAASSCELTATVDADAGALTAGSITLFVEYEIAD